MGLLKEVWTGELLKAFRATPTFLTGIPDYSSKVAGNQTIHLVDVGADPAVLINNTTYPISTAGRTDADVAISLDKFDTENTSVTDDELHGLSYEKISDVNAQHKDVLVERTGDKAIHALAPAGDTADTPAMATAGASFAVADLVAMKRKFDDLKIPAAGRRVVLHPEHIEALLNTNEAFQKQYGLDTKEGKVARLMGWDVFEYQTMPVYNAGVKAAFDAAPAGGDKNASVFFHAPNMFKANGEMKMFSTKAEDNPENRESVIGYRLYNIVLPKKQRAIGAIWTA